MTYRPRRAGKRWLNNAPAYVLDIWDNGGKTCDRYTVFFWDNNAPADKRWETYIPYLGMSDNPTHPQGFSQFGEIRAHERAQGAYRKAWGKRIAWDSLPEHIQRHVIARWTMPA